MYLSFICTGFIIIIIIIVVVVVIVVVIVIIIIGSIALGGPWPPHWLHNCFTSSLMHNY
jgi:hypothetical protein